MARKKSKKRRGLKQVRRVFQTLDLPQELLPGVPKITLVGQEILLVENHMGIFEYTEKGVRLNTGMGMLNISGLGMELKEIGTDKVYITGTIYSANYEQSNNNV